jgi:hypothetical protein
MRCDKLIIGAGLYGLYAALFCAGRGESVVVLEYDDSPFKRATYVNQARVHMGYHYPRSISTAVKSRGYFERFNLDYGFCVHSRFDQIYATSANFSWTDAERFRKFCRDAKIRCDDLEPTRYFKDDMCDGAFLTDEYTYDAQIFKSYFMDEIKKFSNIKIIFNARISTIKKQNEVFAAFLENSEISEIIVAPFALNATYAGINQIHAALGFEPFKIKYELCEIILCETNDELRDIGITVMDGPFFSIMPFGKTGLHSLTSVTFTPHFASFSGLPDFKCQSASGGRCAPARLGNCNECPAKPESARAYMFNLAKKYLKDKYDFKYVASMYSVKPILKASEIDDSRPTVIREYSRNPTFISVLSGKINTVYDLDEALSS